MMIKVEKFLGYMILLLILFTGPSFSTPADLLIDNTARTLIAVLVEQAEVRLFRIPGMKLIRKYKLQNISYINSAYLLHESLFLIGKDKGTDVKEDTMWRTSPSTSVLLSLKTGYEEWVEGYLNSFIDVTISPDGKYLSTCSMDDGCYFYKVVCKKGKCSLKEQNLKLGKERNRKLSVFISQILYPQKDTLIVEVVSPVEESYYEEVKLIGKRSTVVKSFKTPLDIMDAWGNWILLSSNQTFSLEPAELMNLKTGKMYKLPHDREESIPYCTLLSNGNFLTCLLSNDEKEYLKIWDISEPPHFRKIWEDKNQIHEIRFSPNRKVVLLADYTNRELKVLRIHNSKVKLLYRIPFSRVLEVLENGEKPVKRGR